jgi:hypothetical protein
MAWPGLIILAAVADTKSGHENRLATCFAPFLNLPVSKFAHCQPTLTFAA